MTPTKKKKRKKSNQPGPYSFEYRLRVVRMYLEEQYPVPLICKETGVGRSTISTWVRTYRRLGEDGLRPKNQPPREKSRINRAVEEKIVSLKTQHPAYGPL